MFPINCNQINTSGQKWNVAANVFISICSYYKMLRLSHFPDPLQVCLITGAWTPPENEAAFSYTGEYKCSHPNQYILGLILRVLWLPAKPIKLQFTAFSFWYKIRRIHFSLNFTCIKLTLKPSGRLKLNKMSLYFLHTRKHHELLKSCPSPHSLLQRKKKKKSGGRQIIMVVLVFWY